MTIKSISNLVIEKFGLDLFQQSLNFPKNKINIFSLREEPLKIRTIIFDNDREYHLIIDEKKAEIFHDCPLFLIHSEREKKICVHFIKLLSIIKPLHAAKLLKNLENYNLTSDDFGLKKKSKNFQLLANNCVKSNNWVEALNYLNKAISSQFDSNPIIEIYLTIAIENNLFLEFFEFLRNAYENDLPHVFPKFDEFLEIGFKKLLNVIHKYSFFNVLKIADSVDSILKYKDPSFISQLFNKFEKLVRSSNFNENYFSIYLIKRNIDVLVKHNPEYTKIITQDQLNSLKNKLLNYFLSEIDSFCLIDKLKLLKRQFRVIEIPKKNIMMSIRSIKQKLNI